MKDSLLSINLINKIYISYLINCIEGELFIPTRFTKHLSLKGVKGYKLVLSRGSKAYDFDINHMIGFQTISQNLRAMSTDTYY